RRTRNSSAGSLPLAIPTRSRQPRANNPREELRFYARTWSWLAGRRGAWYCLCPGTGGVLRAADGCHQQPGGRSTFSHSLYCSPLLELHANVLHSPAVQLPLLCDARLRIWLLFVSVLSGHVSAIFRLPPDLL